MLQPYYNLRMSVKRQRTEPVDDSATAATRQPKRKKAKIHQGKDLKDKTTQSTSTTPNHMVVPTPPQPNNHARDHAPAKRQDDNRTNVVPAPNDEFSYQRKVYTPKELRSKSHFILMLIVNEYAGETKRSDLRQLSKPKIIEWILRAQEKSNMKRSEITITMESNRAKKPKEANHISVGRTANTSATTASKAQTQPQGRQRTRTTLETHNSNNRTATSVNTKQPAKVSESKRNRGQQSEAIAKKPKKPRFRKHRPTPNNIEFDFEEAERMADLMRKRDQTSGSDDNAEEDGSESENEALTATNNTEEQQNVNQNIALHQIKLHPIITALDINPSDPFNNTKVVRLPEQKEVVIVTATSETSVFQTSIPTTQSNLSAQKANQEVDRPYLKAGKHGWDYEHHRWGFEGDPDLITGAGHQIMPEDLDILAKEPAWAEAEFRKKYPGRLANQWPCGCQKPWDDDDSEDEGP